MSDPEKQRRKKTYRELLDHVSEVLFRHDPIGIAFETNRDEYDPEARTILPRLAGCQSAEEVQRAVHEEFIRWFDESTAGPFAAYQSIAKEIWDLISDGPSEQALEPSEGRIEAN